MQFLHDIEDGIPTKTVWKKKKKKWLHTYLKQGRQKFWYSHTVHKLSSRLYDSFVREKKSFLTFNTLKVKSKSADELFNVLCHTRFQPNFSLCLKTVVLHCEDAVWKHSDKSGTQSNDVVF